MLPRDISSLDVKEVPASVEDSKQNPKSRIDFQVHYESSSKILKVKVVKVINLPFKYRKSCSSFVKVSLLARRKSSAQTQVIHKSLNPEYEECFSFPNYSLVELKRYTLRFTVYVKRHQLKNKLIGDVFFPIPRELEEDLLPLVCTELITPPVKKNSSTKRPIVDLGQIFVLLQYQSTANRMKVLVRKAENLPKIGLTIGQPDFYVIINLMKNHKTVSSSETREASGTNPVWNQPFLFDFPSEDISAYSFQFVIMRGKFYTKDGIIGHVALGPDVSATSGVAHWDEAMQPRAKEVAKWHNVVTF